MFRFLFVFLLVVLFGGFFCLTDVRGASLSGVAYRILIDGNAEVDSGTLISLIDGKYKIADSLSETSLVGVINLDPQIEIDTIGNPDSVPLVKNGFAYVKVSNKNGEIKSGSTLSISDIPGIASLTKTSQLTILGQALEDLKTDGGLIKVDINIRNKPGFTNTDGLKVADVARESFFELFKVFRNASQVPAPQAFKFVLAGLILFAAVIFGFFTFGRVAQRGVEAIGRNPLAKNTILAGLIINVIISVVVIFSGLIAAYYIIRL